MILIIIFYGKQLSAENLKRKNGSLHENIGNYELRLLSSI